MKKKKIFIYGFVRKKRRKVSFYHKSRTNEKENKETLPRLCRQDLWSLSGCCPAFDEQTRGVFPANAGHFPDKRGAFLKQTALQCFRQPFHRNGCRSQLKGRDIAVVIPCPIYNNNIFLFFFISFFIYIRGKIVQISRKSPSFSLLSNDYLLQNNCFSNHFPLFPTNFSSFSDVFPLFFAVFLMFFAGFSPFFHQNLVETGKIFIIFCCFPSIFRCFFRSAHCYFGEAHRLIFRNHTDSLQVEVTSLDRSKID